MLVLNLVVLMESHLGLMMDLRCAILMSFSLFELCKICEFIER